MSFLRHRQIYQSDVLFGKRQDEAVSGFAPNLIVLMSLQPAIPWRVALQHCPPPLHRPESMLYPPAETVNHHLTGAGEFSTGDLGNFQPALTAGKHENSSTPRTPPAGDDRYSASDAGHRVSHAGELANCRADLIIATGSAETSAFLRQLGDTMPVIFVSSDSIDGLVRMQTCESGAVYATVLPLNLPLTPANLLDAVTRALTGTQPGASYGARTPRLQTSPVI
jgi:hypothetical protein